VVSTRKNDSGKNINVHLHHYYDGIDLDTDHHKRKKVPNIIIAEHDFQHSKKLVGASCRVPGSNDIIFDNDSVEAKVKSEYLNDKTVNKIRSQEDIGNFYKKNSGNYFRMSSGDLVQENLNGRQSTLPNSTQ
jgi:hypothetical protein